MLIHVRTATKNYFKSNLLFLLEKNNLASAQFARAIGISKQAVSSWLKEESNISVLHAIQVSNFFSITLDTLFLYDMHAAHTLNNVSEIDIFSNSDIAFTAVDFHGIGNYCNPAMADLLQYNREELISRHSYELIHPFDMQRYRTEMRKLKGGEADCVLIELKYLVGSRQFNWVKQIIIKSPKDERFYIFAFPFSDSYHRPLMLKNEKFFIENIALQELENCKMQYIFLKSMEIVSNFDSELWLISDQSVFQCLIRAMFYQMLFIEIETEPRIVKFSSRLENSKVLLSALINCKPHAKPMLLNRMQLMASMVNATVEETHAGNIYLLTIIFN